MLEIRVTLLYIGLRYSHHKAGFMLVISRVVLFKLSIYQEKNQQRVHTYWLLFCLTGSFSLCVSLSLSLSVCLSVSLCLSLSLCLCLSLSVSVSLSLSLSLSLPPSLQMHRERDGVVEFCVGTVVWVSLHREREL